MRWLAWLLTPLTLVAAVWAGDQLRRALEDPLPAVSAAARAARDDTIALDLPEPQPPMRWPSLFGTYTPPEPQPPRPPEPVAETPPQPPAPPIDSLGFALKGLVTDGANNWAIVSHPTGERLVRVGDQLSQGVTVTAIEPGGITVDNHGTEARLIFSE